MAKADWRKVKFGDVVRLSKARRANPLAEGVERFVGLEHLEPGDLRIRSWGNVADGVTFTSVFKPGQVLFGKRRAYQRKVAVADFSGVCSGDIYVFESMDTNVLLPELLPFICQTDAFFEHAVGTSAGSLSPRTNWTSLADFEFVLPPMEEQRRILEGLQAVEITCIAQADALDSAFVTRTAFIEDFLSTTYNQASVTPLGAYLLDLSYGSSSRSSYDGNGYPILRIPNVLRGRIDYSDLQHIKLTDDEYERLALRKGDVLIVRTNGNPHYVGRSVVIDSLKSKTVYASYLIRIRSDVDLLRPAFLVEYLNAPSTRQRLRGEVKSSAGNYNLNIAGIKKQPICLPEPAKQDEVIFSLTDIDSAKAKLESRLEVTKMVKKQMLATIWGPNV